MEKRLFSPKEILRKILQRNEKQYYHSGMRVQLIRKDGHAKNT